ncbi:MAG: hypothetical protein ACR2K1_07050 [Saprospiraceae bacterium]
MRRHLFLEIPRQTVGFRAGLDFLAESKMAYFSPSFTFFQLRSPGYTPSKRQKLTKNTPIFAFDRKSQALSKNPALRRAAKR